VHLSCQVVVIKGLAYLLTYFIAVVVAAVAWNQLSVLFVLVTEKNGNRSREKFAFSDFSDNQVKKSGPRSASYVGLC